MEIIDGGLRIGKYDFEPISTQDNIKTLTDLEQLGDTLENFVIFHKVEHELNFNPNDFKISVAHIFKEVQDKIESLPTNKQNKYITEVKQCLYNFNQYRERFEAFIEIEVEPAYKLKEGSFSPIPLLKMINQDFELLNMKLESSKILLENHNTEISANPTELNTNPTNEEPKETDERYNSRIFKNYESFLFFVHQVEHFDSKPEHVTDYSYLFTKMKGKYIHDETTNKEYINYMNEYFNTNLSQLKAIDLRTEKNRNNIFKIGTINYKQMQ